MQTKEEIALQEALINTYTYNLKFLSEYDSELFQRVSSLDNLISNGTYKERYFLEFIKENKEFDIYDEHTKSYIYDRKPKQWNNKAVVNTNFDTQSIINLLNPKIYNYNTTDITDNTMDLYDLNELKLISDIQNYRNIRNEIISTKKKKIKTFNKFMFMGTLLGRHIPKIIQKLQTTNHFVCESNLEIFRLSLFVCDYSLLARDGKSVVFSIMDDNNEFIRKFTLFFSNHVTENTIFKYFSTNHNLENYFDNILNVILEKDPMTFDYRLMLSNIVNLGTSNFNKYKTINFGKISDNSNIFSNKNILFIGAGPSLASNIKWLKENQNKFIIVAMSASLKKLTQHDIKPDIITTLDPQDDIVMNHFKNISKENLDKTIKIAAINTANGIFKMLESNTDSLYTYETLKSFQQNNKIIDGISIGEVTFKILLSLGAKNIYLLGIDLALNQKTGHTHIDTHSSHKDENKFIIDTDKKDNQAMIDNTYSLRDDTILIKGNFIPKVTTTRLFYVSLLDYNEAIRHYNINVYNLSENGAFINSTIPTHIDSLNLNDIQDIDKIQIHNSLILKLNQISAKELESCDKQNIKNEMLEIDNIIEMLNDFKTVKLKSYDQFKEQINGFKTIIFHIQSYSTMLPEIYLNFHFVINRYIDYIFNDREVKNDTKDLKKVQYIWCEHLLALIKTYKKYLERLL